MKIGVNHTSTAATKRGADVELQQRVGRDEPGHGE